MLRHGPSGLLRVSGWSWRDGQKIVAERTSGGVLSARYANEGPSLYSALLSDERSLGTVHSFADSSQSLTGSVLRDAFGPELATTGSLPGPFGYVGALGYYHDPDLAMPLLSIRHYAPKRGLFISRDPVLGQPPYGYVGGVPTRGVDPNGTFECQGTVLSFEAGLVWYYAVLELSLMCEFKCGCDFWVCALDAMVRGDGGGFGIGLEATLGWAFCGGDSSLYCSAPAIQPKNPWWPGTKMGCGMGGWGVSAGGCYSPPGSVFPPAGGPLMDWFCGFGGGGGGIQIRDYAYTVKSATWTCINVGAGGGFGIGGGAFIPGGGMHIYPTGP